MFKTLTVFMAALLPALFIQAQSVTQNIRLNKGQKLESVAVTSMSMSQEMMGQKVEVSSNGTITTLTEVKDVNSQAYIFSNVIKRIVSNMSVMGQETNFDSDKKDDMDGQTGAELKGRIGVTQEISVNKQGKIVDVKDTATASAATGMMSDILGSVSTKGTTFPLLAPFPAKAVKAGDTWTDSTGTPETVKMVNIYTLRQVTGNEAIIDITGRLTKTGVIEQQGMQLTMNLTGDITGVSTVDVSAGVLKKNETSMKIGGTMEVMGQSVPVSMNNKVLTTVNWVK